MICSCDSRAFEGPLGPIVAALLAPVSKLWPRRLSGREIADLFTGDRRARYERAMSDPWLLRQANIGDASSFQFSSVWDDHAPSLLSQMYGADLRLYLPEDLMTKVDLTR